MNDPHVESLSYRLKTDESLEFAQPPPLDHENNMLSLRLEKNVLTVWPKAHYPSEEDAEEAVDLYLRAWAIYEAIEQRRRRKLSFDYQGAEVIDRAPSSPETAVRRTASASLKVMWSVAEAVEKPANYPDPPQDFALSPDVEAMWQRYEQYLLGHEPLLSMAYACLSRLEFSVRTAPAKGARKKVEYVYGIDEAVLRKLGELTSNLGDEAGARKMHIGSRNRPPTDQEREWIEAAVRALVRRAGEYSADPTRAWPRVGMMDLPSL